MSDTGSLRLSEEFPPVPTADWEATIQADLKGADYEKRLVWKTEEGLAIRPYYRSDNLPEHTARALNAGPWAIAQGELPPGAILAAAHHEAGATAVQELAYAIAEGADRLAKGADPAQTFVFAVGSNYFVEMAKLRAARLLWARVLDAFGQQAAVRIHAVTALANKSIYDPYTNLLRVTTEALSGVLGGADSLDVQAAGFPDRLARNVQLVIKEEAHLDKVADPAGGSYYIEALTDALAREAWKLFQQIEAEGGYAAAHSTIEMAIAASRAAKEKAFASRRRVLVGVNNYPDIHEKELGHAALLTGWHLAAPIEEIRLRTERHAVRTGKTPKVLLLKRGDLKMKMARGQFCQNFFGCAGFAIEESESYDGTTAALIVLCSSDAEYIEFAREVCSNVKVPVVVAGNPREQIEELKSLGVAGFVHVLSNMVDTLTEWQDKLGLGGKERQ